jgi:hypothetical protein
MTNKPTKWRWKMSEEFTACEYIKGQCDYVREELKKGWRIFPEEVRKDYYNPVNELYEEILRLRKRVEELENDK